MSSRAEKHKGGYSHVGSSFPQIVNAPGHDDWFAHNKT
ncbi:Uncharacterized protein dnm_007900 [Desulfonema magnum]|uniref:Uncharacterized protein n=1 Tax=Desulfonema magnum TaxID=45655 RepID=A0A975BGT5_9BACT|nr:Uncharacterized protein dnm_007900 [Desulfonema magnum]